MACSCGGVAGGRQAAQKCKPNFCYFGCPKHYAFRHQQSHSVALPNLLFGHNYMGFVGTFRMKKTDKSYTHKNVVLTIGTRAHRLQVVRINLRLMHSYESETQDKPT